MTDWGRVRADFQLLVSNPGLHYLDSAATSQKPRVVLDAMRELLMKENNGNYATAKWKLRQGLDEKAQKIVGL